MDKINKKSRIKKIMYLVFLSTMNLKSYGYINIYPTKFEKNIKNEVYEEFTLYNRTKRNIKYRVYLEDVKDKKSMSKWIAVYPKSLELRPLEEKTIKLSVNAPKEIEVGEYHSNLVIKEIETVKKEKTDNINDEEKVKIMTMVKMRLKGYID